MQKGQKHSKASRRKMSQSLKGRKRDNGRRGKKHSEATKKKMSESAKGSKNHFWKGGYAKNPDGRISVMMPEHPFARNSGYIFRSRLVMEKKLGRYLKPCEVVHHIKAVDNDRLENLQLFLNQSAHIRFHNLTTRKYHLA